MKKMFSLALALIMALALCVPAMAATIEVSNPVAGETYNAYKIFDYTSNGNGAYSYSIDTDDLVHPDLITTIIPGYKNAEGAENAFFTLTQGNGDTSKYVVTWAEGETLDAARFATYLSGYMAGMSAEATSTTGEFEELALGYYFVDTSLGSLCGLVNPDDEFTLLEKNALPTIEKEVREDEDEDWSEATNADMNQTVEFQLTVNTGDTLSAGAEIGDYSNMIAGIDSNYVITDTIPVGMTVVDDEGDYVAIAGWTKGTDYTETYENDVLTITLLYTGKLATIARNTDIVITYSATVETGDDVVVNGTVGNVNTVVLEYGEEYSVSDSASVFTYDVTVFKFTGTDEALDDAHFDLKRVADNMYAVATETVVDGSATVYTITGWTADVDEATDMVSPENGEIHIDGLDADTYDLIETQAPDGYNLLTTPVTFVIADELDDEEDRTISVNGTTVEQIAVENKTGVLLPSTGGMGTTLFYIVGGVMAAGAAILLVTKKKLANQE